ncbi:MAG TPA: GspH/FimT family pseudopilin [Verrucomicrobiae bacterium]|nr:GspH/FimT family pseudopilin [Verrucomicrobiae bacterium]
MPWRRRDTQRAHGFTLLEVVAGLGLAMVLAGVGVVQLVTLVQTARLAGAAREVATALRLARGIALSGDASIEVRFDPGRALCETRDRAGALLATRWLPPGVGFAALPARGRVLFGGLGAAENATITLAAGARTRSVIVNQRGRVRVQ